MTPAQIVGIGAVMRKAQKAYFKSRTRENLLESKRLEKEFDAAVKEGAGDESLASLDCARMLGLLHRENNLELTAPGSPSLAGACYALEATRSNYFRDGVPMFWPADFVKEAWQPNAPRGCLIFAAALLLFEAQRLDEQHLNVTPPEEPNT